MRWTVAYLAALMTFPTYAKTAISVPRFENKAAMSPCAPTAAAKADLDTKLQGQLINALMGLDRFDIAEREIRKLTPHHSFVGTVRLFEVCAPKGERMQTARIAIDVQVRDKQGKLTHLFTSTANASSTKPGQAAPRAMAAASQEIAKRLDNALPDKTNTRLPMRGAKSRRLAENDYKVKLIRRAPAAKGN